MSIRSGPYRIVALHCGKFDYAEVEIDTPVHLIGPNNVGKTSLIALLQFLYLDDQRQMQFSRDMAETRRYYFPEKYSYALFECLTPTGFQVVGVHGLGPVRQHDFERFVYTGRIEFLDFLDDERRVREPEDTFARLAVKGFKKLEPRHLRAAITGVGDGRDVFLELVPARHNSTYERFRKVFGNILRLAHIRQDELKQLLLDIYNHEFQQREIDLARHYAAGFEQVKRDSHEVQELKLLQADIERLLRHLERRDSARKVIPALWEVIGQAYTAQKAALDRQESTLLESHSAIEKEQAELRAQVDAAHSDRYDLAGERARLDQSLGQLEEQRKRFEGFVPDWARQRQATVRARQEDLIVKLKNAANEPVEQVRRRLRVAEQNLAAKRSQFENLAHAAVNQLRKLLKDKEIGDAFSVLNPDILKLPVNANKPGIKVRDDGDAAGIIRGLLSHQQGHALKVRGVEIDLDALASPNLSEYCNPDQIKEDIAALERDVRRYSETLDAAEQAESLRAEKAALETELATLIRDLSAYDTFIADLAQEAGWKDELAALHAREDVLNGHIAAHERRRNELVEADQHNRSERTEIARKRTTLQEQAQALPHPADSWPLQSLADIPPDWEDLIARYRKTHAEEQSQAEQVRELLDTIERRTYGRYTRNDESGTIQALRDQIESIPQREKAVAEMWKGIAVGIRKDLQNIDRDLETLKGLVGGVNRRLATVSISNLASLKLLIEECPQWVKPIREVTVDDELPLFSNPKAAEEALEGIGRLLSDHPRVDLRDLFNLSFEVGTPDGKTYRHEHLDAIESNGTTMAIKVLVNLVLLRGLLERAEVQIPFYLDECSSLDQGNLKAIVNAARQMGFVAVLASPDAMDAADKLYFIEEQDGGRVVLDPRTAMIRIQREKETAEVAANA
ncbi:MAG: hypothetical protein RBU21_12485 [FCB group bacterium]|jgi:hypothetical protein|nr:hypothetical protein [FCB group bacterium]